MKYMRLIPVILPLVVGWGEIGGQVVEAEDVNLAMIGAVEFRLPRMEGGNRVSTVFGVNGLVIKQGSDLQKRWTDGSGRRSSPGWAGSNTFLTESGVGKAPRCLVTFLSWALIDSTALVV